MAEGKTQTNEKLNQRTLQRNDGAVLLYITYRQMHGAFGSLAEEGSMTSKNYLLRTSDSWFDE